MFGMRKRHFLIQQFIHGLLVLRVFFTDYISTQIFIAIIVFLLIVQYYKQGYTAKFVILLPLLSLQLFGEMKNYIQLQYIAAILGAMLQFFSLKMYWLPQPQHVVGFREDILEKGLHYFQFFPLEEDKPVTLKKIRWNYINEVSKMIEYKKISNNLVKKIGHLVLSHADKHYLKIGQGVEKKTNTSIAFCHGRGATPLMSSSLLMEFAGKGYRVGAVQHTEVSDTKLKLKEEMKSFREKEVQVRAAEFYQALLKLDNQKIVLMGHSYGCATIIQAYHSLEPEMKGKITHLVCLDPWFFPLSDKMFNQSISCPLLILANEDFIKNPDMHERNKRYLQTHSQDKIDYIAWKHAHHLHQSDMGFINGNMFRAVKNSHMSQIFLELNIEAIDRFLGGKKAEGTFGDRDLGRKYVPQEFYEDKNMMY